MNFLKTIFWVLVAVIGALFSFANWKTVHIALWGGLIWSPPLPFPILCAFLLGLIPMLVVHRARMWTMRRRLDNAHRAVTEATPLPAGSPTFSPTVAREVPPPGATPYAPPPGVA